MCRYCEYHQPWTENIEHSVHLREIGVCPELLYALDPQENKDPYTAGLVSGNRIWTHTFHVPYLEPMAVVFPLNSPLSSNRYAAAGSVERAIKRNI